MAISTLSTPPSSTRPATFNSEADTFLAALPTFVTEANALSSQLNALTGQTQWVVAAGTVDAITATYSPAVAYTDGLMVGFRASGANTLTNPTFNANGLGAKTITKKGGAALAAGDIPGNLAEVFLRYNLANTRFELMNPASSVSEFTSGTFTVSDNSGGSISFSGNSFYYIKHALFYTYWGELTYPSTANGNSASISGFPFTARANSFAVAAWYIAAQASNGVFSGNTNPAYLAMVQNASRGNFVASNGTSFTNANFSTVRWFLGGSVPL